MDEPRFDGFTLIVGLVVGAAVATVLTFAIGVHPMHNRLCEQQFSYTETAADSLAVISNDRYCFDLVRSK